MKILTVCGAGQGSSLILKMNVQDAVKELGFDAKVDNADMSIAKMSTDVDLIMASDFHKDSLEGAEADVITVSDFMDMDEIKEKIKEYVENR